MRVLNIGAGPKTTPIPPHYDGWEVVRLDTEAENEPDLLMDAIELDTLEPGQFDAVYASHLLEHIYPADLERFMAGVWHVLTDDGLAEFRVPDGLAACKRAAQAGNLDAFCYQSPAGAITAWDILYGYLPFQKRFGRPMAHHSAYDAGGLGLVLRAYGFPLVYVSVGHFELRAVACKGQPDADTLERMGIDDGAGKRGAVHTDAGAADVDTVRFVRPVAEQALRTETGTGVGDSTAQSRARRDGKNLPRAAGLGGRL